MAEVLEQIERAPVVLHAGPEVGMDNEKFFQLCQSNPDLRLERSAEGDIIIMPPAGGSSSHGNFTLAYFFGVWARQDGTGCAFDATGGFILPNGATRSPDIAW